jgi:GNAT superfamily N-acetyltransferase
VQEKDYDEIYSLKLYLNNYCAELYPDLFTTKTEINKEVDYVKASCFVIEHDGEVIGFFDYHVIGELDENGLSCNRNFFVESFVIKENFQNKQYGEKLFKFLEEYATKCGCERINLKTMNETRVLHFYNKMKMSMEYCNLSKKIEPDFDPFVRKDMHAEKRVI